MTHRERFRAAAAHRQADRAAYDLCGSPQTMVDYQATKDRLARLLGVTGEKRGHFCVDERILEALDIDTRLVGGMPTPTTSHCRRENGVSKETEVSFDSWGIGRRAVDGRMEICHSPLKGAGIDEIMVYEFPDPANVDMERVRLWAEQAEHLHKHTDYAVIAEHPVLGVFELGCWMFGFDDYLYRLAGEPEAVHAFSGRVLAYQKEIIRKYYGALGRWIDCTTSGDDFGTQAGPFMSTAMFEEMIKPYLQARVAYTRQFTDAFYKHHTCGSVHNLIPSLIGCGVDILNPIQPGAYKMEPERLKADFGGRIAFWGGIDTQHLLPGGTARQVREEVKRVLSIMGNSGYILSPAHTIQYDVPAENVIAIYAGAREYEGNLQAMEKR